MCCIYIYIFILLRRVEHVLSDFIMSLKIGVGCGGGVVGLGTGGAFAVDRSCCPTFRDGQRIDHSLLVVVVENLIARTRLWAIIHGSSRPHFQRWPNRASSSIKRSFFFFFFFPSLTAAIATCSDDISSKQAAVQQ